MSWVTIIMDPNDKKVKIDWFYPKKRSLIACAEHALDKASIYNFYFENLIYKWIKQFEIQ